MAWAVFWPLILEVIFVVSQDVWMCIGEEALRQYGEMAFITFAACIPYLEVLFVDRHRS